MALSGAAPSFTPPRAGAQDESADERHGTSVPWAGQRHEAGPEGHRGTQTCGGGRELGSRPAVFFFRIALLPPACVHLQAQHRTDRQHG